MQYTEGITDHRVRNIRDVADVLARLSPTVSVLMRVHEYEKSIFPTCILTHPDWEFDEIDKDHFSGPGGFIVRFGLHVAEITALTRYSTFVSMTEVQEVYLPAIRSIARALGGTRLVLKSDDDSALLDSPVYLNDGKATLEECVGLIQKAWGDPHPKTEVINEAWEVYQERKIDPWFVETLEAGV